MPFTTILSSSPLWIFRFHLKCILDVDFYELNILCPSVLLSNSFFYLSYLSIILFMAFYLIDKLLCPTFVFFCLFSESQLLSWIFSLCAWIFHPNCWQFFPLWSRSWIDIFTSSIIWLMDIKLQYLYTMQLYSALYEWNNEIFRNVDEMEILHWVTSHETRKHAGQDHPHMQILNSILKIVMFKLKWLHRLWHRKET